MFLVVALRRTATVTASHRLRAAEFLRVTERMLAAAMEAVKRARITQYLRREIEFARIRHDLRERGNGRKRDEYEMCPFSLGWLTEPALG